MLHSLVLAVFQIKIRTSENLLLFQQQQKLSKDWLPHIAGQSSGHSLNGNSFEYLIVKAAAGFKEKGESSARDLFTI